MATTSRLIELSQTIAENTKVFDTWLKDNHIPELSFAADGPLLDGPFPDHIAAAKVAIENATIELKELVQGPRKGVMDVIVNMKVETDTIYRHKIAQNVPLDDVNGISYEELARATGLNESLLYKTLQTAIANRLFSEVSHDRVGHSAASRLWATDPSVHGWAGFVTEEYKPATLSIERSLQICPNGDEPSMSAASTHFADVGDGKFVPLLDLIGKDPERASRFAATMSAYLQGDRFSPCHLVDGYDWASLPEGSVIVDIGGNHGQIATAIAKKFGHLKFIVQDLPNMISTAPAVPNGLPLELMAHSFFDPQPVRGAKVYLLRWILHDWPDKYAIRILQAIVPALEPGSRLLIMDSVVPPLGSMPNVIEREKMFMSLAMYILFCAGDRSASQWENVVGQADKRFRYQGVKSIPGSELSLIEAFWEG